MNSRKIIKIPTRYNQDLAEETGIHIGDGNLCYHQSKGKNHWSYSVHSHLIDDKEHRDHIKKLMIRLYEIEPYERIQGNCMSLVYTRKELILFKRRIGLPIGKKESIVIPQWVLLKTKWTKKCVKGIFDTDGCIRFIKGGRKRRSYPQVKITSNSELLINQIKTFLTKLEIDSYIYRERKKSKYRYTSVWNLNVSGKNRVTKFFKEIGSSNNKHIKKFKIWQKLGYHPENVAKEGFEFES